MCHRYTLRIKRKNNIILRFTIFPTYIPYLVYCNQDETPPAMNFLAEFPETEGDTNNNDNDGFEKFSSRYFRRRNS